MATRKTSTVKSSNPFKNSESFGADRKGLVLPPQQQKKFLWSVLPIKKSSESVTISDQSKKRDKEISELTDMLTQEIERIKPLIHIAGTPAQKEQLKAEQKRLVDQLMRVRGEKSKQVNKLFLEQDLERIAPQQQVSIQLPEKPAGPIVVTDHLKFDHIQYLRSLIDKLGYPKQIRDNIALNTEIELGAKAADIADASDVEKVDIMNRALERALLKYGDVQISKDRKAKFNKFSIEEDAKIKNKFDPTAPTPIPVIAGETQREKFRKETDPTFIAEIATKRVAQAARTAARTAKKAAPSLPLYEVGDFEATTAAAPAAAPAAPAIVPTPTAAPPPPVTPTTPVTVPDPAIAAILADAQTQANELSRIADDAKAEKERIDKLSADLLSAFSSAPTPTQQMQDASNLGTTYASQANNLYLKIASNAALASANVTQISTSTDQAASQNAHDQIVASVAAGTVSLADIVRMRAELEALVSTPSAPSATSALPVNKAVKFDKSSPFSRKELTLEDAEKGIRSIDGSQHPKAAQLAPYLLADKDITTDIFINANSAKGAATASQRNAILPILSGIYGIKFATPQEAFEYDDKNSRIFEYGTKDGLWFAKALIDPAITGMETKNSKWAKV